VLSISIFKTSGHSIGRKSFLQALYHRLNSFDVNNKIGFLSVGLLQNLVIISHDIT